MKYIYLPDEITKKSFSIIDKLIKDRGYSFPEDILYIAKRIVHTAGYVEILDDFLYSSFVVSTFKRLMEHNISIVTDTHMAKSGINRSYLPSWKGKLVCYSHDEDVIEDAKDKGITRAMAACDKAIAFSENKVFVIGNSPTFLFRLLEHYDMGKIDDILVIGVPVGFVGAKESKEELTKRDIPYISIKGTKGGTTYAVAITNALLRLARG